MDVSKFSTNKTYVFIAVLLIYFLVFLPIIIVVSNLDVASQTSANAIHNMPINTSMLGAGDDTSVFSALSIDQLGHRD